MWPLIILYVQDAIVEVPEEYVGAVVDLLGQRRGQMLDMQTVGYAHPSLCPSL